MGRGTEQTEPRGRATKKKQKAPRKRAEKRDEARGARTAPVETDADERQRPAAEELGGESEYSMHEAHRDERGTTHRKKIDAGERDHVDIDPDPASMGRHYLEGATQAPADEEDTDEEPLIVPYEPD